MNKTAFKSRMLAVAILLPGIITLASCATSPPPCGSPQTRNLDAAISEVKQTLNNGCEAHFDR